jgi:antitoxin (DNA-binding transcriptional repressor) of toxin-antitoxin stability system
MTIVTTSEAQVHLSRLIASLSQGEDVVITQDGLPVAQLVRPIGTTSESIETDDDERPWRGVFAIDSPGRPYPCSPLRLSPEPQTAVDEPVDILWDRVTHFDE